MAGSGVDGFAQGRDWLEPLGEGLRIKWLEPLAAEEGRLNEASLVRLRTDAFAVHRQLIPLWRRRTRHGRVLLLNTPIGDGLTLQDVATESSEPADALVTTEPEDARLGKLVRALLPAERAVALAWARPGVRTWADAAQEAGADEPARFGEHVRRKVRRLVAEQERRNALLFRDGEGV
ncbi:hypothetical protein [Streptomyces sp. NPDC059008]|uniref:hypothetical protein n=1 Tax=Streptomyces sp. NPDC059008 TaxID=3346693 RepID=UPI0036919CDC